MVIDLKQVMYEVGVYTTGLQQCHLQIQNINKKYYRTYSVIIIRKVENMIDVLILCGLVMQ